MLSYIEKQMIYVVQDRNVHFKFKMFFIKIIWRFDL